MISILKSPRLEERKKGLEEIRELNEHKNKTFIIHYSCESFITNHGKTPRVTSICVKNRANNETISFSIHLQAQFHAKDFNSLSEDDYDFLEREMLKEFYEFVSKYPSHYWVHWNMRNSNYGFVAIANRFRILKGKAKNIEDELKYDLSQILGRIYTFSFENDKPIGKLLNICNRNLISTNGTLTGKQEGEAFEQRRFLDLHISTLRKVELIDRVLILEEKGKLKVNSKFYEIYGLSPQAIVEIVQSHWVLLLIWSVLLYVVSAASEPIVQDFFGTGDTTSKIPSQLIDTTYQPKR